MAKPKLRFPEFTDEWEEKKLKEIAVFMGGGTPSTKIEKFWNGSIPWVSSSDILEGNIFTINKTRFITREAVEQSATKLIPQNSILLVSRVGVGKLAVSYEELCTSQDFTNLIDIKENIIYIAYTLCHKMQKELLNTQGTSIKGITSKEIKEYKIMIPSTVEQQKIADFLSFVDDIIQVQEEKICALEEQKKGIMQKLFNCEVRFKAEDGREYPEWEEVELGKITKRVTRKNKNNETNLPLTISSIDGMVDQSTYFNKIIASRDMSGYYLLKKGEFAYNKSYSVGYDYGSIKRLDRYDMGALSTLYICFALKNDVNSDYMVGYFDSLKWNKEIGMFCAEGARNHGLLNIAVNDFFKIKILMPVSHEEQQKIADCLLAYDEAIQIKKDKLEVWKEIKKGLLQQMLV